MEKEYRIDIWSLLKVERRYKLFHISGQLIWSSPIKFKILSNNDWPCKTNLTQQNKLKGSIVLILTQLYGYMQAVINLPVICWIQYTCKSLFSVQTSTNQYYNKINNKHYKENPKFDNCIYGTSNIILTYLLYKL